MGVVFSATAMTMRVRSRSVACPDLPPHPSQPTELVFPKSSFQSMWFESSLAWDIRIIGASAAKPHMDDYICDRTFFLRRALCSLLRSGSPPRCSLCLVGVVVVGVAYLFVQVQNCFLHLRPCLYETGFRKVFINF